MVQERDEIWDHEHLLNIVTQEMQAEKEGRISQSLENKDPHLDTAAADTTSSRQQRLSSTMSTRSSSSTSRTSSGQRPQFTQTMIGIGTN